MMRFIYLGLGCLMLALGIIGAFLPVMPSTIFLIFAAGFFARSSPRLEAWLLDHKQFGPTLKRWRDHRAISRRGKIAAWSGMALGYVLFLIGARPDGFWALFVLAIFLACAAIVWRHKTMD